MLIANIITFIILIRYIQFSYPCSLLPVPCSLFPVPCSLKSRNFIPHPIDNCYKTSIQIILFSNPSPKRP
ncbi:MAG: hypothetical protein F6K56_45260 [Moorea sp. SIO3G5]|nr:hypothetical protein [Moorena sp. SIO3G5]